MTNIKINENDNLIIQPFMIGKLLLEMKSKKFEESSYFNENFEKSLCSIINEMTLDSQGVVIVLLYIYLVVPYEKLKKELEREYNRMNTEISNCINQGVIILNKNYKDNDYLYHMRNSVAHVKFAFVGGTSITFIDEDKKNGKRFELIMPLNLIHIFLFNIEKILINYFINNREEVNDD